MAGKRLVIWPQYFDSSLSRRMGRKVSSELAVPSPKPEEIERALRAAGLKFESKKARYPRTWWQESKMFIIEFEGSKTELLKIVAAELKKLRGRRKS